MIGLETRATVSRATQPIRCKTKTNFDFPRFKPVTCFYFEFSLAPCDLSFCFDWAVVMTLIWSNSIKKRSRRVMITVKKRHDQATVSRGEISLK